MKAQIKRGQLINAGNFLVSIGSFSTSDVAIISKHNGRFVKLSQTKRSKKLRTIKRLFNTWINNNTTFNFQFVTDDITSQIIAILRTR